jgi:hypothetical protein
MIEVVFIGKYIDVYTKRDKSIQRLEGKKTESRSKKRGVWVWYVPKKVNSSKGTRRSCYCIMQ